MFLRKKSRIMLFQIFRHGAFNDHDFGQLLVVSGCVYTIGVIACHTNRVSQHIPFVFSVHKKNYVGMLFTKAR
jgi:hypothetical protein